MVNELTIGIIGIQGAISEHINSINSLFKKEEINGKIISINNKKDFDNINALILPGGESTTISKILVKTGLYNEIKSRIKKNNLPIMGTCAGCVLLAKEISNEDKKIKLLKAMDMKVTRNSFGRQKDSFEKEIDINVFEKPYNAVFIRAPSIEKVWGSCKILAKINNKIIMVKQDNLLAISFHPELTKDNRIHKYFLNMIL
jgi:5'-phosphate synthase pdxT subunit